MTAAREKQGDLGLIVRRKAAMAVLAQSATSDIAARLVAITPPAHDHLRVGENGLVMVRGRIGGDGAPFNLGEATVSRAAVRLATGEVGFGYTLGRDRDKAGGLGANYEQCLTVTGQAHRRRAFRYAQLSPEGQRLCTDFVDRSFPRQAPVRARMTRSSPRIISSPTATA